MSGKRMRNWIWAPALVLLPFLALKAKAQSRPYNISQAAGVYLTPRGQEYFQNHLNNILANNGVDLSKGRLDEWEYTSPTAVSLASLPVRFGPYRGTLLSLRNTLQDWLTGFTLNNPRFAVKVEGARYEAQGLTFRLSVDPQRTAAQADGNSVVVMLEVDIPEFYAEATQARGHDLNNAFLGTFGINHPWIRLNDRTPFTVQIPIRVHVADEGGIDFQTLDVHSNAPQVKMSSGFDWLLLPQVQVQVNERTMTLDTRPVDRALRAKEPELIQIFLHHLQDFIETELPGHLNEMAYSHLKDGFATVKEINPPGVDPYSNGQNFKWGLRLSGLSVAQQYLHLALDGYVDDPQNAGNEDDTPVSPPGMPTLSGLNQTDYDFAFVVSDQIVNRVLRLGFQRGAFEHESSTSCDGSVTSFRLVQAPVYSAGPEGTGHGRLHIVLETTTHGVRQTIALHSPFQVEMDLDVYLRPSASGSGFDMVMNSVDESSAHISDDYLRFNHFRSDVADELRSRMQSVNQCNSTSPLLLAENISVPTDLYGLPVHLQHVEEDPSGQIALYMVYGETQQ